MIYYQDEALTIRTMAPGDPAEINRGELEQGYPDMEGKYNMRLEDMRENRCVALVAEYHGVVAGYNHLYFKAQDGPFAGQKICEIVDFGVLEKYRCCGVGTKLMDIAEQIAAQYGDTVCLRVGLHSGYGSAQRMYVKRGYIPDGSGVWYEDKVCGPYQACVNGDSLVLYFSKKIRSF